METFIFAFIIIGLIVYGLERNRRHQSQPRSRLAGSSDIIDRDTERFHSELRLRN